MKLENEILYVEMVEHGAELTRIYNKRRGQRSYGMQIQSFGKDIRRFCSRM